MQPSYLSKLKPIATTTPASGSSSYQSKLKPIAPTLPKASEQGIFRMETLKGIPSYQASEGGFSTVLPNLAKTAANIPSSAVSLARGMVVDPVINTVKVPIEAVKLVKEQGLKKGFNLFAQGFADTVNKGVDAYKKVGEVIYNNLEKNVVAEDSVVKGLRTSTNEGIDKAVTTIAETAIEDPLLLPSILYAPGKLKGSKGKDTITTIAEPFIKNPVVDKVSDLTSKGRNVVSAAVATRNQAKVNNIIQKRADEIAKIEGNYANTRKANQFSKDAGYSSRQRVASTDVLVDAVDENGLIRTKGEGGAVEQYRKMTIDKQEGVVRDLLQKEGASIDPKTLSTRLKSVIENDPLIKGDAKTQALAKVDKEIAAYKRTSDGRIPLTEIHDAKIATTKTIKDFATPAEYKTYQKSLARGLKEAIEDSSTANVKQINAELSKYYDDISLLERLDGKRVKGGKLGKYFAQISGNIVGGAAGSAIGGPFGGAVGAVVGGELSSKVKGSLLSRVLGGRTGQVAPKSKILQEAVENVKKPLLGLPAPKKGAPQSINVGGGVIPIAPQGSKMEFVGKDYSKSFGNRNTKYNTTNTPNINANIPPSVPQPAKRTFMDMLKSEKGAVSIPVPKSFITPKDFPTEATKFLKKQPTFGFLKDLEKYINVERKVEQAPYKNFQADVIEQLENMGVKLPKTGISNFMEEILRKAEYTKANKSLQVLPKMSK